MKEHMILDLSLSTRLSTIQTEDGRIFIKFTKDSLLPTHSESTSLLQKNRLFLTFEEYELFKEAIAPVDSAISFLLYNGFTTSNYNQTVPTERADGVQNNQPGSITAKSQTDVMQSQD